MTHISRDININGYIIKPKGHDTLSEGETHPENRAKEELNNETVNTNGGSYLNYLGEINKANARFLRVQQNTQKAVDFFERNPDLASSIMDFEDDLIDRGYSQQDAFHKAEIFFKALKTKEIYSSEKIS